MTRRSAYAGSCRWPRFIIISVSAIWLSLGCSDGPTIDLRTADLPPSAGVDDRDQWQSSAWDQDWLEYPGNTTLRVEHGLGRIPRTVLVYMSFSPDGHGAGLAAGDAARVSSVDEQHVAVQNATEEDFFVRITIP